MTNLFLRHAEVLNKKNIQYANLPGFQISDKGKEQSVAAGKLLKNSNLNFVGNIEGRDFSTKKS